MENTKDRNRQTMKDPLFIQNFVKLAQILLFL